MTTARRLLWPLFLLLCLLPITWTVVTEPGLPLLGFYHDDGVYYLGAQDLAQQGCYRILSLPGQEYQTKYPPLPSLLYSLAWRLGGSLPQSLPWAHWLAWVYLPFYLHAAWLLLRDWHLPPPAQAAALAFLAIHPFLALLANSTFSDGLFSVLVLWAILACHRERWLLAGLITGLAALTRTQGTLLIAAILLLLAYRRQWRPALRVLFAAAPLALAWTAWTATVQYRGDDPAVLYFVDYARSLRASLSPAYLRDIVPVNLDILMSGIGWLLLPAPDTGRTIRTIHWVVAALALCGAWRLSQERRSPWLLLWFALNLPIYLTLNGAPAERYHIPLLPLLLAGCYTELHRLWQQVRAAWQRPWGEQLLAAALAAACLFAIACAYWWSWQGSVAYLPQKAAAERQLAADREPAFAWVRENTPPEALFETTEEPAFTLFTGRRALGLPVFHEQTLDPNEQNIKRYLAALPAFMQQRGLRYVMLGPADFRRTFGAAGQRLKRQLLESDPRFRLRFRSAHASVWELQPR